MLLGLILSCLTHPVYAVTLETGGTNYSVFDLGAYGTNPTEDNWNSLKYVLTQSDQNPILVSQQIAALCESGQKKIGLMLWFIPQTYDSDWADSSTGKPTPKVQNNITTVLTFIKNQKNSANQPCFNEVQFRFAPMGPAHPLGWTAWDEAQYLENKEFIWFTRNLVKSTLSGSHVAVVFDLAAEQAGQTNGMNSNYLKRLWKDYTDAFGVVDTYGFSIAWAPGRFTKLIEVYDSVGKRPTQHAIDIYDIFNTNLVSQLEKLYNEMKASGEGNTPILIQETYFSDQQAWNEIHTIRNTGLNIRSVMQWQMTRRDTFRADGVTFRHFSTIAPDYIYYGDDYNPVPPPTNLQFTCVNNGTQAILSWNSSASASSYAFRLDELNNNLTSCQYGWLCPESTDLAIEALTATSYQATILPGQPYNWWIHTRESSGAISDPAVEQFSCPLSVKPGDLNVDGRVDIFDFNLLVSKYGNPYTIFDFNAIIKNYDN